MKNLISQIYKLAVIRKNQEGYLKMKFETLKALIFIIPISFCIVSCSDSNLKEITKNDAYNLDVQKVETPRGVI